MSQLQIIITSALFGLFSGIIIQFIAHKFSSQRENSKWQRDNIQREIERLETELIRKKSQNAELQNELAAKKRIALDYLIYGVTLMNQRRDILLGFDKEEQLQRADEMRAILSKLSEEELMAIKNEEKSLPELAGKPKSLSS